MGQKNVKQLESYLNSPLHLKDFCALGPRPVNLLSYWCFTLWGQSYHFSHSMTNSPEKPVAFAPQNTSPKNWWFMYRQQGINGTCNDLLLRYFWTTTCNIAKFICKSEKSEEFKQTSNSYINSISSLNEPIS